MTQTLRRPPRQNPGIRRKGRIYCFTTLCVVEEPVESPVPGFTARSTGLVLDGSTEDGYVGKTRQTLAKREQQHRGGSADGEPVDGEDLEEQPWWDITVGGIRLLEQGFWTDDEIAERERYWIDQIRPRYNYIDNTHSPTRIAKYTAREHRNHRDRARGLQPRQWTPFGQKPQRPAVRPAEPRPARKPSRMSDKWRRRRNGALTVAGIWAAAQTSLWLALALLFRTVDATWFAWPICSAGIATAALILVKFRKARRKWRWVWVLVWCAVGTLILYLLASGG